jgi:hypothetical protein
MSTKHFAKMVLLQTIVLPIGKKHGNLEPLATRETGLK